MSTAYEVYLTVSLSDAVFPFLLSAVKFEDCQRSREVGFISSDPNFSVRPDGTVYTQKEVANLSEPVQFMVTAWGLHDPHIWETTVKLALVGHLHSLPLTKVTEGNGLKTLKCLGQTEFLASSVQLSLRSVTLFCHFVNFKLREHLKVTKVDFIRVFKLAG